VFCRFINFDTFHVFVKSPFFDFVHFMVFCNKALMLLHRREDDDMCGGSPLSWIFDNVLTGN